MSEKKCNKCCEVKPLLDFFKCKRYKDGHYSWCKCCMSSAAKKWKEQNKSRVKEVALQYALENSEKIKAYRKQWRIKNVDKEKDRDIQRRRKDSASHRARVANYAKRNQHKINAKSASRRARSRLATPSWLTEDDINRILVKYKEARFMSLVSGIKHEVDHIIPLNGDAVSGLHVPWNLRVIPINQNRKKSKKLVQTLAEVKTMS